MMGIWIFLLASGCFCAGYCLSGMLGYGTREDLEREVRNLKKIEQNQRRIIELKDQQIKQLEAENQAIYLVKQEKTRV